ncbi:MAG: cytochrome P450 [Pseudonocardiales bacterium]|nr:cytochrome P450 [Pseudonocardiales bacterium]MBV9030478.1 cytochrome P450 [Pseudonocardiales bacterium]
MTLDQHLRDEAPTKRDPAVRDLPLAPPGKMGPPPEYDALQRECPMASVRLPVGDGQGWFLSRYDDVRSVLADPRLVRPTVQNWPPPPAPSPRPGPDLVTMMELEGPRHTALRRALADVFSVKAVRAHQHRIREQADRLLDAVAAGGQPGELVRGFTEPFPLLVMCDLVGIPYDEREHFVPLADAPFNALLGLDDARRATAPVHEYATELIERKRREPAEDILTDLVRRRDAGELTDEDVITFGLSMLLTGHRTSAVFLTNAVLLLLTEPEQFVGVRATGEVSSSAVEELLRYLPVMNAEVILQVTEDVELCGRTVAAGETVLPSIAAANRDETVFPDAGRLDLTRVRNPHLAFGRGAHNCVGAHLGRAQLKVGLEALLARFPSLHLTVDEDELAWDDEATPKAPLALPVGW